MAKKAARPKPATTATRQQPGPGSGSVAEVATREIEAQTLVAEKLVASSPGGHAGKPRCDRCEATLYTVVRRISDMRISRVIDGSPCNLAIRRQLQCKNCGSRYCVWFFEFTGGGGSP